MRHFKITALSLAILPLLVLSLETALGANGLVYDNSYGSYQPAPGVIGMHIKQVRNQTRIDQGPVARLNSRLKSRIPEGIGASLRHATSKLKKLMSRSDDEVTEATVTPSRTSYYSGSLQNKLTYYLMNITLGTPPQQFMVQVDTGSSDLWVPGRIIQFSGFNSKHSSTFKHLSDDFRIKYVKDSAQGYWAVDKFQFGGSDITVDDLQFAVATAAPDATMGILGIGPIESEVSHIAYPNLPFMLAREGLIPRAAYSIYMDSIDSNEGTILFGGSDKAKYKELSTLPIVSKSTISVSLNIIAVTTSLGPLAKPAGASKASVNDLERGYLSGPEEDPNALAAKYNDVIVTSDQMDVLLDTGTSLTYLPADIVTTIAKEFSATFDDDVGMYVVHKDELKNNPLQGINFQFKDQLIYMPKKELFWPLSWFSLEPSPYYAMTILSSEDAMGYNILGDSFLRSAYVIYDLERKEVHIGQYVPSSNVHIVPF